MIKFNPFFTTFLLCLLFPVVTWSQQQDLSTDIFPGTAIILPVETNIKLKWIISPTVKDTANKERNNKENLLFSVDNNNQPWIGHTSQNLLNLKQGYQIKLSHTFTDLVHLDNGAMLFSTPTELGIAIAPKALETDSNKVPLIPFQPITSLPLHDSRMFKGAENSLYFTGRNPLSGENEIYILRSRKVNLSGTFETLFGQFYKVFSTTEPITAVSGDGDVTYLALGNLIVKVSGSEKETSKVYLHPYQDIKQLIYLPKAGLIFSTGTNVGYIGQHGSIEFLTAPVHTLTCQNENLYILFHESFGVLALENITDLKKMDIPFQEVEQGTVSEIKISTVRFFEYGPPDYTGTEYAERFDRSTTRYLSCQIDLENQGLKNAHNHAVTTTWQTSSGELLQSNTVMVSFTTGLKSKSTLLSMGEEIAGSFFPGQYSVKIYIDAAFAAEKVFSVFGEVNLFDAIRYHDSILLGELLENGSDPNQKDSNGLPVLHDAVLRGSFEDVRLLLKSGANVNITNNRAETALNAAGLLSINDGMKKAELLIKNGINIEAKDRQGQTAFFNMALPEWNRAFLDLLLLNGANINTTNNLGSTALSTLIEATDLWGSHMDIVDYLLLKGARLNTDPEVSDFTNLLKGTPDPGYVSLFLKYGANILQTGMDERNHSGNLSSLLNTALLTWLAYIKKDDRPNVQKALETVNLLIAKGAKLLPEEEKIILTSEVWEVLENEFIKSILDRNQDLMLIAASIPDPRIQPYLIEKLLEKIKKQITTASSDNDLAMALKLGSEVRKITEEMNDVSWPEVYLYCGVLEQQSGANVEAEHHLKKYISLIPSDNKDLEKIKSLVKDLAKKNKN